MKKTILFVFCFHLFLVSKADWFQIKYFINNNKDSAYVSYASVSFFNANNIAVYTGTTDKYGRILVKIPNGIYKCQISYSNRKHAVNVSVNGDQSIVKPINIREASTRVTRTDMIRKVN
jgi:hypothetical protein